MKHLGFFWMIAIVLVIFAVSILNTSCKSLSKNEKVQVEPDSVTVGGFTMRNPLSMTDEEWEKVRREEALRVKIMEEEEEQEYKELEKAVNARLEELKADTARGVR